MHSVLLTAFNLSSLLSWHTHTKLQLQHWSRNAHVPIGSTIKLGVRTVLTKSYYTPVEVQTEKQHYCMQQYMQRLPPGTWLTVVNID